MADYNYPLHLAAESGNYDQVCSLLEAKVNIDETDLEGNTPLSRAVQYGQTAIVKLLLEKSAKIDVSSTFKTECKIYSKERFTCKHIAAKYGHLKILKLLMATDEYCYTDYLLHSAAEGGQINVINYLLGEGYCVYNFNFCDCTPLHTACENGQIETVKVLLEAGANILERSCDRDTPLNFAIMGNHVELVKFLLIGGDLILMTDRYDVKPLYIAAEWGHDEIVQILLGKEPPTGKLTGTVKGYSFLHKIVQSGQIKALQYFLNHGASIDVETSNGLNLLHVASGSGHKHLIQFFLDKGLDVNCKTYSKGNTPLHYAVCFFGPNVIDLLVQNGADFEAKNNKNCTPLDVIIKIIINRTPYGQTFLRESAKVFVKYMMLRDTNTDTHFLDGYLFLEELLDYKSECIKEIEKMDQCMIGNTRISWYRFLRDTFDDTKLVTYLCNENIRRELEHAENFFDQFLVYADLTMMIEKRIKRGTKRQRLLKEAHFVMNSIYYLPEECTAEILTYLKETDLDNFIKSKNVK